MNRYLLTDYGVQADAPQLQTEKIQAVFDMCKEGGGTVAVPAGVFRTGGLMMYSDTTLELEAGAVLRGSDNCEDYAIWEFPAGVKDYSDMEMIRHYYNDRPWAAYRRAILSAYGQRHLTVCGKGTIDGSDCYDMHGEEGFRGPHGIYFTGCEDVTLRDYTIQRCGNFMHQVDNCRNVTVEHVTCIAGHDGIHLHCCVNTEIRDCVFHTGDDCIAGINMKNLHVIGCELNTSCNLFRIGGVNLLMENTRMWGPGLFPHRMTVVTKRGTPEGGREVLPDTEGRHTLLNVVEYFSSPNHPEPFAGNILFRNCEIANAQSLCYYDYGNNILQKGTPLTSLRFENVRFTGLRAPAVFRGDAEHPLQVTLKGCTFGFAEGAERKLYEEPVNATVTIEE